VVDKPSPASDVPPEHLVVAAPTSGQVGGPFRVLASRIGGVAGSLAAGQLLVGLTYVIAARNLTPANLGIIATCFAIGVISANIFDFGLNNYLVRETASARVAEPTARALVRRKRRFAILLMLPNMVACLLIAPSLLTGLVLGLIAPLVWEAATANSRLGAQERFARAATAQVAARAVGLAATVVLTVVVDVPELALPVGLAGSFALEALLDRLFLGAPGTRPSSVAELVRAQRASMSFGFVSLASIGQQVDTPVVAAGGGAGAAGIYAGAGRLIGPLLFLSSAMAVVGGPRLARVADDPDALRREERRIGMVTACISLAPLGVALLGPALIPLILGPQYVQSGAAFSVLAVGAAFSTVSQGMAIMLQNRGHETSVARAISTGLVSGLVATYVLAVVGGPAWAAVGFLVSQLYIVLHLGARLRTVRVNVRTASEQARS